MIPAVYQSAFGFRVALCDEQGNEFETAEGKTVDECLEKMGLTGKDFGTRWNQRMNELGAERPTPDEIVKMLEDKP